jgi:CheY-like chemotaxis protein
LAMAWLLMLAWRRRLAHRYRMEIAEQRRHIAEQASAAKSQFLATLSHEIRTPMTGVIGMAELLLSTSLSATQREYAEAMQRSGAMLLKLLNDALDMARIEAGKLHLELAPFDPRALVFDVLRLQQSAAQLKGLSIAVDIGDDMPQALLGDALRIKQVLFNLANNALKFTAHGSVTVHMTWRDDELRFEVIDTGPGIPESSRERLFRRFEQEDGPHRQAGSGLGLAICRELVSLMGGMLTLESEIGRGSTFIVQLPLVIADEIMPHAAVVPAQPVDHALDVLLVEDNETVAATICGMLEQQGHRVRCARNALSALTELTQGHCDVILLDLDLPGIDGYQVANLIRQGEVTKQHMPIIAVTARTGSDDELRSREAGMDGFLRKPLTGAQLSAALNEVFAKPSATATEADLA